jgi:hypothetical protein
MLDYQTGWIFLGADGKLYRLEYDVEGWRLSDPEAYPRANGWSVDEVGYIETSNVFPPWEF